ncbi:MAG TPA: hypothetical protein VMW46_10220 [Candidatus Desulfaltia sp.]|nr:hypothetical protein [Candidatus Desulfaltia sp.]
MRKTGLLSLIFFLWAFGTALAVAQETDISGGWQLTIQSPRGPMTIDARFVQEGTKLTVTMTGPRGGESTGEGTIQGQAVQWSIKRSTGGGERTIVYKGTVEGQTMSGTADLGEMGTVGWTATKK